MTKYRVPIKISFDGAALVEAEDEEEAEKIAVMQLKGYGASVASYGHPNILNWVVEDYGTAYRRDNESIEEIEDD